MSSTCRIIIKVKNCVPKKPCPFLNSESLFCTKCYRHNLSFSIYIFIYTYKSFSLFLCLPSETQTTMRLGWAWSVVQVQFPLSAVHDTIQPDSEISLTVLSDNSEIVLYLQREIGNLACTKHLFSSTSSTAVVNLIKKIALGVLSCY